MKMIPKMRIPCALREQVWIHYVGKKYESKCYIKWCNNIMDVYNFHVSHNIPESKGGLTVLENLRPLCARCNLSMNNNYTIQEWNQLGNPDKISKNNFLTCCFKKIEK